MARPSEGRGLLFVYGTLQFREVREALLHRVPHPTPATATGWRVARLAGRVYPVLVPGAGVVPGCTIDDLTPAEWDAIDHFEDDCYDLRSLQLSDGRTRSAYVSGGHPDVLASEWDAERFSAVHLRRYVERCARWREAHENAAR